MQVSLLRRLFVVLLLSVFVSAGAIAPSTLVAQDATPDATALPEGALGAQMQWLVDFINMPAEEAATFDLSTVFTPGVLADVPADQLGAILARLRDQLAPVTIDTASIVATENLPPTGANFNLVGADGTIQPVSMTVNPESFLISSIWFSAQLPPAATAEPTVTLTAAPTETATEAPTEAPTETATSAPTETATIAPTETATTAPTETPAELPTETPTELPTETPTEVPTETPTEVPTETPTEIPTETPTDVPTETPTDVPTETPTEVPTETPTDVPTETPTEEPTETPTEVPTETPTELPTETPTEVPTETPTDVPTDTATPEPTETPTEEPTETPTATATDEPTETPTDEPTETPTEEPTQTPTDEPTETPTELPTETPTEEPTETPTEAPTETPTEAPTETATATAPVSVAPTKEPTAIAVAPTEEASPVASPVAPDLMATEEASPIASPDASPVAVVEDETETGSPVASPVADPFGDTAIGQQAAWTWATLSNDAQLVPESEIEEHVSPELLAQAPASLIASGLVQLQEQYGPFTLDPDSIIMTANEPPTNLRYTITGQDGTKFDVSLAMDPNTVLLTAYLIAPSASSVASPVAAELPAGISDTEVTFSSGPDTIYGSFMAPADLTADAAVPAALIISGSGATDRDGNSSGLPIGTNRNLALTLAEAGIPSLRYDKLGSGQTGLGSHADLSEIDYELFLQEARDAAAILAEQPGVDPSQLMLVGHSEGALFALALADELATAGTPPAGLILVAPLSIRYLDLFSEQTAGQLKAAVDGGSMTQEAADATSTELASIVEQIRTTGELPETIEDPALARFFNPANTAFLNQIDQVDPGELAAGLPSDVPVLVLLGAKDAQVTGDQVRHLLDGFSSAGNDSVTFVALPKADHTLRIIEGDADPSVDYANPDLEFSPQAVTAIEDFLAAHELSGAAE